VSCGVCVEGQYVCLTCTGAASTIVGTNFVVCSRLEVHAVRRVEEQLGKGATAVGRLKQNRIASEAIEEKRLVRRAREERVREERVALVEAVLRRWLGQCKAKAGC